MRRHWIALVALTLTGGCATQYPTASVDLDSGNHDKLEPARLASVEYPNPTSDELAQPIVVAAHGYTATPYETKPTTDFLRSKGIRCSDVMLGAHGVDVQTFEKSTWHTWQKPVIDEINALKAKGYQDIRYLGTSTGGTLFLEGIAEGTIPKPKRMALVAPLIEIHNKLAGYAGILPFVGMRYLDTNPQGASVGRWYRFRPAATVATLVDLCEIVKASLRTGLTMSETQTLIIQSNGDTTVDPVSADIIKAGVTPTANVTVKKVESTLHIPIWPDDVDGHTFTDADKTLREQLMQDIYDQLKP